MYYNTTPDGPWLPLSDFRFHGVRTNGHGLKPGNFTIVAFALETARQNHHESAFRTRDGFSLQDTSAHEVQPDEP